jgi:hypothetical protein
LGVSKYKCPYRVEENEIHYIFSTEYEGWDCNQLSHFALDIGYHVIKSYELKLRCMGPLFDEMYKDNQYTNN